MIAFFSTIVLSGLAALNFGIWHESFSAGSFLFSLLILATLAITKRLDA